MMRSESELRQVFALIGTSLGDSGLRRYVWPEGLEGERTRAHAALQALGWVLGYEQSTFTQILLYVLLKSQRYLEEKHNAG
jgi:hypothetical protein